MQPTGTSWLLANFCAHVLSQSTQMVQILSAYFILQRQDLLEAQSPRVVQSVAVQLTRYKILGLEEMQHKVQQHKVQSFLSFTAELLQNVL